MVKNLKEKIWWKSLPKNARLRFDSNSFYWEGNLIYWFESEKLDAQRFLNTRIRY
jgi:hypothetical protein